MLVLVRRVSASPALCTVFLLLFWLAAGWWQGAVRAAQATDLGSSIIVGFQGTTPEDQEVQMARDMLEQRVIRGVLLFRHNITSPTQLKALLQYIKSGRADAIIGIDQEGGVVKRMDKDNGFPEMEDMPSAAEYKSADEVYRAYNKAGRIMADMGITTDFAPVLDVNVNPKSPAIGARGRSFSKDPSVVASYGAAAIKALADAGITGCGKHFPGHGSAKGDTHEGVVDVTHTWQRKTELQPYITLTRELKCVMVAHTFNSILDKKYPASMSAATYKLLPEYNGKYITDDYFMKAISTKYTPRAFADIAIKAGADLVIFGRHPKMLEAANMKMIPLQSFVEEIYKPSC